MRAEDQEQFHSETRVERDARGGIETEVRTEATDAAGTVTRCEAEATVGPTRTGGTRAKVTRKTTRDTKGLLNEATETSEVDERFDPAGALEKRARFKVVDRAGTRHQSESKTKTVRKARGGTRTVMEDTAVRDPKGPLNRRVVEKTTTVDRGPDGKAVVSTERRVAGQTVERKNSGPARGHHETIPDTTPPLEKPRADAHGTGGMRPCVNPHVGGARHGHTTRRSFIMNASLPAECFLASAALALIVSLPSPGASKEPKNDRGSRAAARSENR